VDGIIKPWLTTRACVYKEVVTMLEPQKRSALPRLTDKQKEFLLVLGGCIAVALLACIANGDLPNTIAAYRKLFGLG
jgi:hypothetical protein